MSKLRIAVIFGGVSNEHEISLISATNIISCIDDKKFEVICIGITKKGRWFYYPGDISAIRDGSWEKSADLVPCVLSPDPAHNGFIKILPDNTTQIMRVDCVFPVLHGKNGEDGTLQGLLDLSGIPYVGCGVIASCNAMDKEKTHIVLESAGIKMTPYIAMRIDELDLMDEKCAEMEQKLSYPMFIKPANCGSSVGVSKARNLDELVFGIKAAFAHDKKVVVEKAVVGRECECAVMGNSTPFASTVAEIVTASDFYDYEAKYQSDDCQFYMPARISEELIEKVRAQAVKAYRALECTGLTRVDFFVCDNGDIILNEPNTLPGFTAISMYPQLMKHSGIEGNALVEELIRLAFERAQVSYE